MTAGKPLVYEIDVYTFDIDSAGHANNGVYIRWLEVGRTKLLEAAGLPIERIKERGNYPILTHTEITYKKPLFLGDTARIELSISEISKVRIFLEFRVYRKSDNGLVATAKQSGAFIQLETQKPARIPPEDRERFEKFLAPHSRTSR